MDRDETAVDGDGEHVQHILLAIDNFTRKVTLQVSEMLDSGRAMFKDLGAVFEDRLSREWRSGRMRSGELRARAAANEQIRDPLFFSFFPCPPMYAVLYLGCVRSPLATSSDAACISCVCCMD
ncbi:uncharacterized protein [Triticum aestivum]|uniref:Uncharacterized protein n=1 Tax=Aegilops tauschii subsp. strangulata TaxID=200361 RepID=A0A453EX21_AEGTS|nr:uncharacterized protein LOC109776908 isoform X2 [Aegilops tauschii subsp. strangulata]XP_044353259.1 uncharacterized protein LOC123074503 isoform X2 [Triticum aestivum]